MPAAAAGAILATAAILPLVALAVEVPVVTALAWVGRILIAASTHTVRIFAASGWLTLGPTAAARALDVAARLVQDRHLVRRLELGLTQVNLSATYLRVGCLVDQLLGDLGVIVSYEAEATTLATDRISHYLGILDGSKLLEVLQEVGVSQGVVKPTNEHFVSDALRELLLLVFGVVASRAVSGATTSSSVTT